MKLLDIIAKIEHNKDFDSWDLTNLLDNFGISWSHDIKWEIFKNHHRAINIKEYIIHEFSVDDHTGFYTVFTLDGKPFASSESYHEDSVNYKILDTNVYKEVVQIALECCSHINDKDDQLIVFDDFEVPLIQMFDSSYNVMGKNLLYIEDDGTFTKIERHWQDREKIKADAENDVPYKDMYYYKSYEIITNDVQRTVHFRRIVSVIGDNAELADKIAKTMNLNKDPEFEYVFKYLNFIKLGE